MANLVSPGYNHSALINQILPPAAERIIDFKGLNKKSVIDEGEMPDMWNLTADAYPLLTPRKPRGEMDLPAEVKRPLRIIRRFDKIGVIAIDTDDNVSFFYDGVKVDEIDDLTTETQAIAINNKMCFFPQKTCIDITKEGLQEGTYKSLEAETSVAALDIEWDAYSTTITLPVGPEGHIFHYDDAINISGTLSYTSGGQSKTMTADVSCIIESVEEGELEDILHLPANTFVELIGQGATDVSLTGTIKRTMPDLDMVVEWNNRLWGCSNAENTIYASKLGDPSNWQYFQGTGLDSYYAQQGTDENFTGIAEYSGHIIFFKPSSMTRVYGTAPSNYQITNTKAYGVEEGSSRSVLTINDTVFYKSAIGIMAYQGGVPVCISEKINRRFKNVVAATEGTKYYASCIIIEPDGYIGRLLVFDIEKGMWHMEDALRFTNACKIENKIYCATTTAEILMCGLDVMCDKDLMVSSALVEGEATIINPDDVPVEDYEAIEWAAEFGPFDEYIEEKKIYSKLAMRLKADANKGDASVRVFISLNEGPWEQVEYYEHVSTKGDFIPIIPRRCDRYSVRLEGKGYAEVKSLTRRVRQGSFGRL